MTKEAEAIYNSIREWHERDCSENHNDPSIYFAYRRLADHLAAPSPAPDAGLVEREAVAKMVHPQCFSEQYVEWFPDRSTIEQYNAYQTADAILALLSPRTVAREPVAWQFQFKDDTTGMWHTAFRKARPQSDEYRNVMPLYTTPAPSGRDPATIEACIQAVEDAGGDNEDYHSDAIRALAAPVVTEER